MKVNVLSPNLTKLTSDTLVVGIWQETRGDSDLISADALTDGAILRFLEKNKKFGKPYDLQTFHLAPTRHPKIEKVVIAGLGESEKLDNYKLKQIAAAVGKAQTKDARSVAINLPKVARVEGWVEAIVIGFNAGVFDPGHYKTEKIENGKWKIENLELLVDGDLDKVKRGVALGQLIADSINKVREVVNQPANIVTPEYMVKWAREIASANKLKMQVFSEAQVNQMGMGLMASVAKGSEEDLYFVVMEYRGSNPKGPTLALVGKGITFDSGGISIKPSESMEWMKMDMAGAAAVFGAINVIAKLKSKINVIAACPLTENLPSGRASKPGDVVRGLSGKTAEIINTDAEGRLVLADAITYVERTFKPDYMVDVATLTGASVVALGNWATAILGRPQEFVEKVKEAALEAGERVWQLPLYEEYRDQLKSYIADIANVSSTKGGGTETGAKFIEEFVDKKVNWAHLDIAPTAWEENDRPYASKGATGTMVSTLVNLALSLGK